MNTRLGAHGGGALQEGPFELRLQGQVESSRQHPDSWAKGTSGRDKEAQGPRERTGGLWGTVFTAGFYLLEECGPMMDTQ